MKTTKRPFKVVERSVHEWFDTEVVVAVLLIFLHSQVDRLIDQLNFVYREKVTSILLLFSLSVPC